MQLSFHESLIVIEISFIVNIHYRPLNKIGGTCDFVIHRNHRYFSYRIIVIVDMLIFFLLLLK